MRLWVVVLMPYLQLSSTLASAIDIDEDGLNDVLEQELLDRYRPHYYYNQGERYWPASLTWLVSNSILQWASAAFNYVDVIPNWQLQKDPSIITTAIYNGQSSSTYLHPDEYPGETGFRIHLPKNLRGGEGPVPVGVYGHVVRCTEPVGYQNESIVIQVGTEDLLIQYWQYFPFNAPDIDGDYGWHSCDWTWLDVYVSASPPYPLKYIVYHHHGDGQCSPTVCPDEYPLPEDGIPKCFLEKRSHEWWPYPWIQQGSCAFGCDECAFCHDDLFFIGSCNQDHEGDGKNYRTEEVINVGERFARMPGAEPLLFFGFNGRFGRWASENVGLDQFPSKNPVYQFFPSAYAVPPTVPPVSIVYSYVNPTAPAWDSDGLGSRHHPHQTLAAAVDQTEPGGTIRVVVDQPLATPVTICNAVRIEGYTP